MKSPILCASFVCGLAAFAQQVSPKISFEVVSVKPSEAQTMNQIRMTRSSDPGRTRFGYFSLKDYVRVAYRVKEFQVEGPEWIEGVRFDVEGKFPEGATEAQVPEMLQSMLADRFKLAIHRETKEHAIYALVPAKGGPRLKAAEQQAPVSGQRSGGMSVQVDEAGAHLKAPSATLSMLSEMLSRFSELPVVDMTGIEGQYEFDLVMAPETLRGVRALGAGPGPEGGHGPSEGGASSGPGTIHEAVQKYGLKLERRRAPMEMIVVDHIEKSPTEN